MAGIIFRPEGHNALIHAPETAYWQVLSGTATEPGKTAKLNGEPNTVEKPVAILAIAAEQFLLHSAPLSRDAVHRLVSEIADKLAAGEKMIDVGVILRRLAVVGRA